MGTIVITVCGLFIILGFEIRHRQILETLLELSTKANEIQAEIARLKSEMKLKKNIYEEHNPPASG